MGKANFTEDFKRDAVLQITERGYPVAELAARLGISKYGSVQNLSHICQAMASFWKTCG